MHENDIIKVKDAFTFHSEQLPSRPFIIGGGLLPANGIAVVGGISKAGKSILVMNMALCIARGKPFLGFNVPEARRVLYLQSEISEHSMQDRLRKMLHAIDYDLLPERLFIINHKGIKLDQAKHLERIGRFIENYKIGVLILDPFYKLHNRDENKVSDMARVFDSIDRLVQQHKCACAICHHFGKPQEGRDGATLFRGSSTISDYGDSYIMLQRKSKESRLHVKLSFVLRNAEEPEPMVLYRDPNSLWYSVQEQESRDKVTAFDVAKALEGLGGFTAKKEDLIAAVKVATGAGRRTVTDAIKEAEGQKLILSHNGTGRKKTFYLPDVLGNQLLGNFAQ